MGADWADDLALALSLADAADEITGARFLASDLAVSTKPDLTPVTDADEAVEREVRRLVAESRPSDPVVGEEFGSQTPPGTGRRWVVDPIDGTKNFVRGVPVWGTLIALQVADASAPGGWDAKVGVVSAPALARRWWAARDLGAWTKAPIGGVRRCAVSGVRSLPDAFVSYASRAGWGPEIDELLGSVWRTRAYGDFLSHLLVAEGAVDISCEPEVSLWDVAALQPIVEEAGGRFSDLAGDADPGGGSIVCTNGWLHDEVLRIIGR